MNTIPNFDGMMREELMAFWSKYRRPRRKSAEKLIGDCRPGYTNITSLLANYALHKAVAIRCREQGEIRSAQVYEQCADMCYQEVPADLRW